MLHKFVGKFYVVNELYQIIVWVVLFWATLYILQRTIEYRGFYLTDKSRLKYNILQQN